jgi:hemerythrin
MSLMTWDQSYSVKVAELDGHHQKLFFLLNSLHDAMRAGKGNSIIRGIVDELAEYTQTHFQREEALMEQTKYPALDTHRVAHQNLIAKVAEYKAALDSGQGVNTSAVLEFLRQWLANHINRMDKAYASHLNANGIH